MKQFRKLMEMAVSQMLRRALDNQEPGVVARLTGSLRDEMRRQSIIKRKTHHSPLAASRSPPSQLQELPSFLS